MGIGAIYFMMFITSVVAGNICTDLGWFHGSKYCMLDEKLAWEPASTACREMGRELVVPDSQDEHEFVWEIFLGVSRGESAWIGCSREGEQWMQPGGEGRKCLYFNWAPGEPRIRGDRPCLQMWHPCSGLYDDVECHWQLAVICESPAEPLVAPVAMSCPGTRGTGIGNDHSLFHCLTDAHVITEFPTTEGVLGCGLACRREPRCRSFHLRRGGRRFDGLQCQLNNITRSEADNTDIKLDASCNYFNA